MESQLIVGFNKVASSILVAKLDLQRGMRLRIRFKKANLTLNEDPQIARE